MDNLLLQYQYTDREGYTHFNIINYCDNSNTVLGALCMKYGKDDQYGSGGISVIWSKEVSNPEVISLTEAQLEGCKPAQTHK